jgi:hypothetical protein
MTNSHEDTLPREWCVPYALREAWNKAMSEETSRLDLMMRVIDEALISAECAANHRTVARASALKTIRMAVDKYKAGAK